MPLRIIDAPDAPNAAGGYAQAIEVRDATRWLYLGGQLGRTVAGEMPEDFAGQCRLAWANVEAQLRAADMSLDHLVKVTVFLADRAYSEDNRKIRAEVLGARRPALSVLVCGFLKAEWLIEIEAVAAA